MIKAVSEAEKEPRGRVSVSVSVSVSVCLSGWLAGWLYVCLSVSQSVKLRQATLTRTLVCVCRTCALGKVGEQ